MENTLVINLFAGPGTGKSSTMAGLFSELKFRGVNCEQAPEFAKEKVWEKSFKILENQIYVFGKQLHTIRRLQGQVDAIITDSPLMLSIVYDRSGSQRFKDLVVEVFKKQNSLNIMLRRHKKYNPSGRMQTEEEAKELDNVVEGLLKEHGIDYLDMDSGRETIMKLADIVIERIGQEKQEYV